MMRPGVDRIQVDEGAGLVGESGDRGYVDEGADGVGGDTDRHQPDPLVEQSGDCRGIELAGRRVELGDSDLDAGVLGGRDPRCEVGVVVERGHDDDVAWPPPLGQRPADRKGDAGHVLPERDLRHLGVEEVGHGRTSLIGDVPGVLGGVEPATEVAHPGFQDPRNRVDHRCRYLGATRTVEPGDAATPLLTAQGGEAVADRVDVECAAGPCHRAVLAARRCRPRPEPDPAPPAADDVCPTDPGRRAG